jgi:1-aminocyclopropane-1-carboxylate deaminase/D-cysteine desulfhydrase-like pyridoxal-dependent ACC family enzyme
MVITNSSTDKITLFNRNIYIKRDDLLHKDFSGNKARKFHYFLENSFPSIDTIVSFGSNQSNAMYSLSVLAKLKNWNFKYFINHLPSFLKEHPSGNYKYALLNGMELFVDENFKMNKYEQKSNELFIEEGGAIKEASFGIEKLANEIKGWKEKNNIQNLKIFLPSGTGTTALFLQAFLEDEVFTTPCVGDSEYLKYQFSLLEKDESLYPKILNPKKKYHFGKLYNEHFTLWNEIENSTNIEFDLLYDPIGFDTLREHLERFDGCEILYIHQGGILGNETMKERYLRKKGISKE